MFRITRRMSQKRLLAVEVGVDETASTSVAFKVFVEILLHVGFMFVFLVYIGF